MDPGVLAGVGPGELLRALVDSSDDAICATDLNGTITLWNPAAERIFGYTAAEALGQDIALLIPEDRRSEEEARYLRARAGQPREHYETTLRTRRGETFSASITVSPVVNANGQPVGASHIIRDVTTRLQIQRQALHLAALVESADDAIASKDLDGVVQSWNPAAERLFGYSAAEMVGRSIRTIIPLERWPEEDEVLRRIRRGDRIEHFQTIRQRKDGSLIPISLTVSPIRDHAGVIIGASKIARDISEHVVLHRDRNRLAAIVDSSDDAIISKDANGVIQTWNQGAERMFGYSAAEAIGKSIALIIPADRLDEEEEVLRRIRRGLKVDHYETVRQRKDGTLVPISLTVSPIFDVGGAVVGASKIARDLSTLRAYATTLERTVRERTAALEAANAQLEAFAYSVSHDLRAPLRGMQGLSQALLEDYAPALDERGHDYARRIVAEAALLDRLIQDLLAYSRLTRVDVTFESLDLREIADAAQRQLQQDIESAGATLIVDARMPRVKGNRAVLVQVLTNLVSNAIKFGGANPLVRVRGERRGAVVRVWVEDSGIGIDAQHHERIFRAFERLHAADRYPGTGIGLAIVRKGIERLGGAVGLESQPGAGSRFWFELPEADAA